MKPIQRAATALLILFSVVSTAVAYASYLKLKATRQYLDIDFRTETNAVRFWGLSFPENFGRWSNGKTVEFVLTRPQSGPQLLYITALAEKQNVGKPIEISWGKYTTYVVLTDAMSTISIKLPPQDGQSLTFSIPEPTAYGEVPDMRWLGIAFSRITMIPQ